MGSGPTAIAGKDKAIGGRIALLLIASPFFVLVGLAKNKTWRLTETEAPPTTTFHFAVVCVACELVTSPFGWLDVGRAALIPLIASGLFGGLAPVAITEAVACAPVSTLAPFKYSAMIWALLFDFLIFALRPELASLIGALLIVAAAASLAFADRISTPVRSVAR